MPLKTPITCKLQSGITKNAQSVVHVRSAGLFVTDPVLRKQGAKANYFKTGHSWSRWPVLRIRALFLPPPMARVTVEGGSWESGAGLIAIHGRRFLRNKTTTRKIPTVAAIKAPVRISPRERPTST